MSWEVVHSMDGTHVKPIADLRPHDSNSACWCRPVDDEGVWVHNSADRREHVERGEAQAQ